MDFFKKNQVKSALKLIWKIFFNICLLPLYNFQKILSRVLKNVWAFFISNHHPEDWLVIILCVIAGITTINHLLAQDLRPEQVGKNSILYKISTTGENFDDGSNEEFVEGPINRLSPNSYLEGGLTQADTISQDSDLIDNSGGLNYINDGTALIQPDYITPGSASKTRSSIITYKVGPGDTLGKIAQKFDLKVNTILWENNLTLRTTLKLGQDIKILPVDGVSYTIKKNDNLKKISQSLKANPEQIIEFNKLASADDLKIGQTLIIPGGQKAASISTTNIAKKPSKQPEFDDQKVLSQKPVSSKTKLLWPTNSRRITQYFKFRHPGLDVGNDIGQPIFASADGVVETAGWNRGGYGNYIIISHGNGLHTLYGHASKLYVSAGESVTRGQVIAAIGSTGRSTGPHLHYEVRVGSSRANPLSYVR